MRIVFIGTPHFSVPSLQKIHESSHELVGVITAPDRKAGRGMKIQYSPVKDFAIQNDIPLLQPTNLKDPGFQEELRAWNADIQVVIAFRMLPESVWDMPPRGTINLHASLLPDYRGAAPINWAIINGETETGLTTFQLVNEIDKGEILLQHKMMIGSDENAGSLHDRMMIEGADLVLKTLDSLESGELTAHPQDDSSARHAAPKIFKEDCIIDWKKGAKEIHDLVRGLSPYPVARTFINDPDTEKDLVLKIFRSSVEAASHDVPPGVFDSDGKSYVRIACSDGWLHVHELQLEGRRRMETEEFLRGYTFNKS